MATRLKGSAGSSVTLDAIALCPLLLLKRLWERSAGQLIRLPRSLLRLMTTLVRYGIRLVAELNHRVRGFDAGRQERRQEHERAFGRLAVRHHRSDGQRPQRRDPIGAGPSHRWIVDLFARRCERQHHLEADRSTGNALANLVFEIV